MVTASYHVRYQPVTGVQLTARAGGEDDKRGSEDALDDLQRLVPVVLWTVVVNHGNRQFDEKQDWRLQHQGKI